MIDHQGEELRRSFGIVTVRAQELTADTMTPARAASFNAHLVSRIERRLRAWKLFGMVSNMETIEPTPDPRDAAAGLNAAADAQRAVRDRPWPTWLYPINAALLGGVALAGILPSSMLAAIAVVVMAGALAVINYWAGRLTGAPFAVPTSVGFRILAAASGMCVIGSLLARSAGLDAVIVVCSIGAVVSYGLASVVHYRSTHR